MMALAVLYLVIGALVTRNWPRFRESGKTFLVLVFPAHVVLYLVLAQFTIRQLRDGFRIAVLIVFLILLFTLLSRQ